jgi:hypothetical protein
MPLTYSLTTTVLLVSLTGRIHGSGLCSCRHDNPRLIDYNGELMLKLPQNYNTLEDEEKMRVRTQVGKSLVLWTYETETKNKNSVLHDMLQISQVRTRRDTVDVSANTWDGDIVPFRQCLIRIARYVGMIPTI